MKVESPRFIAYGGILLGVVVWFFCNVQFGIGIKRYSRIAAIVSTRWQSDLVVVWGIAAWSCIFTSLVYLWLQLYIKHPTRLFQQFGNPLSSRLAGSLAHTAGTAFTCYAFVGGSLQQVQVSLGADLCEFACSHPCMRTARRT